MGKNEEKKDDNKRIYIIPDIEVITIGADVITSSFESGGELEGGYNTYNIDMFD